MKNWRLISANGGLGGKIPPRSTLAKLHPVVRYAAACGTTALAAAIVGAVDITLLFPPFLLFAMAAGLSLLFCGLGPCLLSIGLGALTSDFFFVQPRYELSLNGTTAGLASVYAVCAAVCWIAAQWAAKHGGSR